MAPTRRFWVLLHRYVGLAIALFVAIAGLTGSLVTYREAVQAWISPHLFDAPARGSVLPPGELVRRLVASDPRLRVEAWPLDAREGHPVRFYVRPRSSVVPLGYDNVAIDPVSGQILGRYDSSAFPPTADSLVDFLYRVHYSLALPGRWGYWIMGLAAILWFFDCFVGAWLTWPLKAPRLTRWRPAWLLKRSRINHDLHRAGGLWFWALLAVLALSSVMMNLADEVFMPVYKLFADVTPDPFFDRARNLGPAPAAAVIPIDQAIAIARTEVHRRGWTERATWLYHDNDLRAFRLVLDKPEYEWLTPSARELTIDDRSGAIVGARVPNSGTRGDIVLDWLGGLHVGSVLGWPYKVLLCITGFVIAMLSVTGVVVWWRKRNGRLHRTRSTAKLGVSTLLNEHLDRESSLRGRESHD